MRKKGWAFILIIIFLGAIIGSALGEVLSLILPQGVVREFFLRSAEFNVGPATLNLVIITLTLGIGLKINVTGIIGIVLASYILRWVD